MKRQSFVKGIAAGAGVTAVSLIPGQYAFAHTIKVGILHPFSGTMAISETVRKDVALMAIDEINAKAGVLGRKLEPVVVDPASNLPLLAEKARQLLSQKRPARAWTASCASSNARA